MTRAPANAFGSASTMSSNAPAANVCHLASCVITFLTVLMARMKLTASVSSHCVSELSYLFLSVLYIKGCLPESHTFLLMHIRDIGFA